MLFSLSSNHSYQSDDDEIQTYLFLNRNDSNLIKSVSHKKIAKINEMTTCAQTTCTSVTRIQATWRSYITRKKVSLYSALPSDVWRIILNYIVEPPLYCTINKILQMRMIRLYWCHPRVHVRFKLHTLALIKKYQRILHKETINLSIRLCVRLLKHSHNKLDSCLINSVLECFDESHLVEYVKKTKERISK